ncbi:MAG: hypothetical protein KDA72_18225, partial [Planctomycetales bacterium]|nr:hypothetical protein [Planctomycetales bacterium]
MDEVTSPYVPSCQELATSSTTIYRNTAQNASTTWRDSVKLCDPNDFHPPKALLLILILRNGATEQEVDHVIERVEAMGLTAHLSRGTFRTIVGIIGDEDKLRETPLRAIAGVADVIPVLPPYKLASRDAHPQDSVVEVSGVKVGGGNLAMIAGPCSVEEPERMDRIAQAVRASGANIFRGGAYKPRTSPYAFQGLGVEGLKILREAGRKHSMPVVTEVTDPRNVEVVAEYSD